jgi:hypothetical protein
MSRYLDGLEQGAKVKFGNLEGRIEKLENITLDYDGDGIWLVEETFDGDHRVVKQMGHISWATVAVYIREYLQ